jgi:hypothetical protein
MTILAAISSPLANLSAQSCIHTPCQLPFEACLSDSRALAWMRFKKLPTR